MRLSDVGRVETELRAKSSRRALQACAVLWRSRCAAGVCFSRATPRTSFRRQVRRGLNLAASDVRNLALAMTAFYQSGSEQMLDVYSDKSFRRVWKAQRFSWWMTSMLHLSPEGNEFDHRRQLAELDYVTSSRAAMTSLAENYTGLPMD